MPSYTIDQMLDFCDKYFDTLVLDNCKGRNLRAGLKKTLKVLENDIKVDSQSQKHRLNQLINRDLSLVSEDALNAFEKEHQY